MTQREEFEAWAKSKHLDVDYKEKDAWGRELYTPHIQSMWTGWQAAQAAQPAHALNWSELVAWWESGAEQWEGLRDIVSRMVARAKQPAQPEVWKLQFLTDVTTAAGLLGHGKQDKGLAARIGADAMRWRSELFSAAPSTKEGQP